MNESQPTTPATPTEEPQPPRKLTAYEVRNQYLEYVVLTFWAFALFTFDGWFNPDIHATGFNKSMAVLLAIFGIFAVVMFASAQLNISRQPRQVPDLEEMRSRYLWALAKFVGLTIWFIQDRNNPDVRMKPFDWLWLAFGICAISFCGVIALRSHIALENQKPPEPPTTPPGTDSQS
jgi:hypothetical protein